MEQGGSRMLQPDYRVRLSNLPCRIHRLKNIRRFLFHPVAHGYLLGAPSKKLRALYSRQRRYNPFGKQIAVRRRAVQRWSNRYHVQHCFTARGACWFIDHGNGTYTLTDARRAWAANLSRFRRGEVA
jgi:hypothetical protein